ncbi:uncharacterized protein LOC143463219 [Clavelina lepadiformis]|uniref:uncharacterized protein LOC143463219 n=1 Tax=Clavelina lepadiformis TaxID=159417 RepID=UPI004041535F
MDPVAVLAFLSGALLTVLTITLTWAFALYQNHSATKKIEQVNANVETLDDKQNDWNFFQNGLFEKEGSRLEVQKSLEQKQKKYFNENETKDDKIPILISPSETNSQGIEKNYEANDIDPARSYDKQLPSKGKPELRLELKNSCSDNDAPKDVQDISERVFEKDKAQRNLKELETMKEEASQKDLDGINITEISNTTFNSKISPRFSEYSVTSLSTDYSPIYEDEEDRPNVPVPIYSFARQQEKLERSFKLRRLSSFSNHTGQNWRSSINTISTNYSPPEKIFHENDPFHDFKEIPSTSQIHNPMSVLSYRFLLPQKLSSILVQPGNEDDFDLTLSSFSKKYFSSALPDTDPDDVRSQSTYRFVKEKAIVDESGGVVCTAGCKVTFPKSALSKEAKVELRCIFHSKGCQCGKDEKMVISPIVCCEPADLKLNCPVVVEISTCFVGMKATVSIEKKTSGLDWASIQEVTLEENHFIKFKVNHLSSYRVTVTAAEFSKLAKRLVSVGFLKHTGFRHQRNLSLIWCITDDMPHLVAQLWLEMSQGDVYERIMEPQTFFAGHQENMRLKVTSGSCEATPQSIFVSNEWFWAKQFFAKYEFSLKKPTLNKQEHITLHYVISGKHEEKLMEGSTPDFAWARPCHVRYLSTSSLFSLDEEQPAKSRSSSSITSGNEAKDDDNIVDKQTSKTNDNKTQYPDPSPQKNRNIVELSRNGMSCETLSGSTQSLAANSTPKKRLRKMMAKLRKKSRKTL